MGRLRASSQTLGKLAALAGVTVGDVTPIKGEAIGRLASTPSASTRTLKFGSATPATIAAASRLDLWYNETALKIHAAAETA